MVEKLVFGGRLDLRGVIASSLTGGCTHEPVCAAVHRMLEPGTPTSDYYCCRATGSLCEAIYDAYYEGATSGQRVAVIYQAVLDWLAESHDQLRRLAPDPP
jgi:hypothetical protein